MTPAQFIAGLPKAELHMHIEGSIEPALMLALARRNGVAIRWQTEAELRDAYRFTRLQDFLDLYYDGCRVLLQVADFHEVTRDYLRRAHADGVRHAEMFLGPQGHTTRGVPLAVVMQGVLSAMEAAEAEDGITSGLILVAQRHRSEEEAMALLAEAEPWYGRVLGFGLGGAELGHPPSKFERFFARCRERGFKVTAHAGEEGPAAYVREAVELLQVDRLDHGNACLEDPALVQELARRRIPLTVCPLSNLKLQVVTDMAAHPLKKLMDAGLCVTVNSDDPSYFGGYVNDNYLACQQALGLTQAELAQLARQSFEAAFMPEAQRAQALAAIDAWVALADADVAAAAASLLPEASA
ncbi:adenosine deaminase [Pseudacidovorax sp. RU35E]|uniref:adenosine deaminase n=1 Tax=Pseudacidovorax sp. RU35E TaxID=1907403 RepID=UPI00095739E5|nr:adenosine deaminase [Pseudacidovorax sp. RU35E]SIR56729.1 adenosine deaminase [Pseudacidovorax sp. RU35E]